jgi:hypothetical protein
MAKFYIQATYAYSGEIDADTAEQAEQIFLEDLDLYYDGTDSYECEEIEEDDEDE